MIITRKIECYVDGNLTDELGIERSEAVSQLYNWERLVRKSANYVVAHKFVQNQLCDFSYIKDQYVSQMLYGDGRDLSNERKKQGKENEKLKKEGTSLFIKDILNEGPGLSEENVTYRAINKLLDGAKIPSDFKTKTNHYVVSNYNKKMKDYLMGKASVPSYKNIPIPFPKKVFDSLKVVTRTVKGEKNRPKEVERYDMNFYGIPLTICFGKDRSGNRKLLDKVMSNWGGYSFADSSLQIDRKKYKMYLLVAIDIPETDYKPKAGKTVYAKLDFECPIVVSSDKDFKSVFRIGNAEEYLHRRLAIQRAVRNCQINNKYTVGGHGRKKKNKAIERFHEKEANYVESKMHLYSRCLINYAVKERCEAVVLYDYTDAINAWKKKRSEERDKVDDSVTLKKFVLRNWGYYKLDGFIEYKAKKAGLKVMKLKCELTDDMFIREEDD